MNVAQQAVSDGHGRRAMQGSPVSVSSASIAGAGDAQGDHDNLVAQLGLGLCGDGGDGGGDGGGGQENGNGHNESSRRNGTTKRNGFIFAPPRNTIITTYAGTSLNSNP